MHYMRIPEKYRYFITVPLYLFLSGSFIYFFILKKDNHQNEFDCRTKDMAIKGVITYKSGHGDYVTVQISNIEKPLSLNIEEEISSVGYPWRYSYEEGDSVIKKAGSKEFIVKKDGNVAVYLLDCDD